MARLSKRLSASKEQVLRAARLGIVARLAPRRILHQTAVLSPDNYLRLGVRDARLVAPAETVSLTDPDLRHFLEQQLAVAAEDGRFQTEAAWAWALDDAMLHPATGAVVAADGSLLIDSIKNEGRLWRVPAYSRAMPVARPVPGTISTIMSTHTSNHFHWLLEALPRLHSLRLYREAVTLVAPASLPAAQRSTLDMCLPPNVNLIFADGSEWLLAKRLILPSFLTRQWDFAYLPLAHLSATRNAILGAHGLSPDHAGRRRIYISRAKAGLRHLTNETEAVALLRQFDFDVVYLEELAFADQVRLLHDAAIVVGQHGAGLANLLFAGPIPVVELATPVATPVYFFLALALGQDYHYVLPAGAAPASAVQSMADGRRYSAARDADITVPLADLQVVLEELLQDA